MERVNRHAEFLDFCRYQECGDVDFLPVDSEQDPGGMQNLVEKPLPESNSVSSLVKAPAGTEFAREYHRPLLDLDMRCMLIESSTPGHHHLFIDKVLDWQQYQELLECLGRVGILQKGFVDASIKRGRSRLRTPWTKKESTSRW